MSEMMETLKLLALAIYFLIYFFSLPIISKPLKLPLPLQLFIHPDKSPLSFPYLLRPRFVLFCFFYLLNKLLRDALMSPISLNRFISRWAKEQCEEGEAGNKPLREAGGQPMGPKMAQIGYARGCCTHTARPDPGPGQGGDGNAARREAEDRTTRFTCDHGSIGVPGSATASSAAQSPSSPTNDTALDEY